METKVLTQEEVQQLTSVREQRIKLIEDFGVLEMNIQELNNRKEILRENLKKLTQEESKLGEILQQKYGNGSINLEKGEFISS